MTVEVKCNQVIRAVGYYAKVESLNDGKQKEYEDRQYMEE